MERDPDRQEDPTRGSRSAHDAHGHRMGGGSRSREGGSDLTRVEIDRVAANLVQDYGEKIMLDAIEFSFSREDAEDAYQRSLELLLTKAPSSDPKQLVPWLRVVVRNEARHIAQSRRRHMVDIGPPEVFDDIEHAGRGPEDLVEAVSMVEMGFEALGRLSKDQIRCLLAQAEGLNYEEISDVTGFSRRKVTRCIERGRRVFVRNFDAIEAGAECARFEPLIHRVLQADADAAIELRPHLRHCIACRQRLRDYESAPRDLALLMPPALVISADASPNLLVRIVESATALLGRAKLQLLGADRWAEVTAAKKAVAIFAAASLTAGGGAAVKRMTEAARDARSAEKNGERVESLPRPLRVEGSLIRESSAKPIARRRKSPKRSRKKQPAKRAPADSSTSRRPAAAPTSAPPTRIDDGSIEFSPESGGGR